MENLIIDLENLRTPSEPLTFISKSGADTTEGAEIISKLKAYMEQDTTMLALAAPQIAINKRIFCLRFNDQIKTFINPIITKKKGLKITLETSSTLPGKEIIIGRPEEISVVYYNDDFKYEDNKLIGVAAATFDQQVQLLDGILPDDLGLISDVAVDGPIEDSDLPEIITFYKDTFLPSKLETLNKAISTDKDSSKNFNQLKFTEDVINGRSLVIENPAEENKRARAKKVAKRALASCRAAEKATQKKEFNAFINKVTKKH